MPIVSLLSLLARSHAEVYEVWPQPWGLLAAEDRALNPQPLPPHDPTQRFLAGTARMMGRTVEMAIEAQLRGEPVDWLAACVDDFCGTPPWRRFPSPPPGPGPEEGPFPEPWVLAAARAASAVLLAGYADRLRGSDLGEVLARGAEQLAEAATADQG